jgi:hypothetical protein
MSIFSTMLEKLGLKKAAPPPLSTQASSAPAHPSPQATAPAPRPAAPPPPPKPVPVSEADVVGKLEKLAADNPQKLNWRSSIVDLMKLLGMESSLAERKELAAELGYAKDQMGDSAKMNIWLHKEVLRRIAQNGGNIPKEMLD